MKEFRYWTKRLLDIDDIDLEEKLIDKKATDKGKDNISQYIFLHKNERILYPFELSTGEIVILSYLISIYTFLGADGMVMIEEPESYLHPQAITDLIHLLRELSETKTVIFTTHSPIVINSMLPSEVTLMKNKHGNIMTSINVESIDEAIAALKRGYMSFGDLLQTNFNTKNGQ